MPFGVVAMIDVAGEFPEVAFSVLPVVVFPLPVVVGTTVTAVDLLDLLSTLLPAAEVPGRLFGGGDFFGGAEVNWLGFRADFCGTTLMAFLGAPITCILWFPPFEEEPVFVAPPLGDGPWIPRFGMAP